MKKFLSILVALCLVVSLSAGFAAVADIPEIVSYGHCRRVHITPVNTIPELKYPVAEQVLEFTVSADLKDDEVFTITSIQPYWVHIEHIAMWGDYPYEKETPQAMIYKRWNEADPLLQLNKDKNTYTFIYPIGGDDFNAGTYRIKVRGSIKSASSKEIICVVNDYDFVVAKADWVKTEETGEIGQCYQKLEVRPGRTSGEIGCYDLFDTGYTSVRFPHFEKVEVVCEGNNKPFVNERSFNFYKGHYLPKDKENNKFENQKVNFAFICNPPEHAVNKVKFTVSSVNYNDFEYELKIVIKFPDQPNGNFTTFPRTSNAQQGVYQFSQRVR